MLQTTTWIPGAGKCRPEGNALAHSAAFQRLAPPTPPDHSHGMDRKKHGNFPCNGAWQPSIIMHRLTCEVSFPDAELEQCTNKGGAPCFGRGRRQDSVSNIAKESPVSHFIHSRFIPRKEVRSGPIKATFPAGGRMWVEKCSTELSTANAGPIPSLGFVQDSQFTVPEKTGLAT